MYLIIYAHPDEKSFNYSVLKQVKESLEKKNLPYQIMDLYKINYDPVLSLEELKGKNSDQTIEFQKRECAMNCVRGKKYIHPLNTVYHGNQQQFQSGRPQEEST